MPAGALGLEALNAYLRSESLLELPKPTGSQHSAGYDAWVTAEVFIRELDLWLRSDELRRRKKEPQVRFRWSQRVL